MGQKGRDRTKRWRERQVQKAVEDSFKVVMEKIERKKDVNSNVRMEQNKQKRF